MGHNTFLKVSVSSLLDESLAKISLKENVAIGCLAFLLPTNQKDISPL